MSHTTHQKPDAPAATLATAEDAAQMDLPIGVYGEGKYGECRNRPMKRYWPALTRPPRASVDKTEA